MILVTGGYREHLAISGEIKDLVIADAVLTVAFALMFSGGLLGLASGVANFLYFIPIAFVAVTLSFVLHEYMHKIVAQKFGAIAGFRKWDMGIIVTLASSLFGVLIGLPGATMIYASRFTEKEEGYVSLAGPLTNFAVFLVFLAAFMAFYGASPQSVLNGISNAGYIEIMIVITMFISAWLAFFNMLPIYPLDGSKVLRWNRYVYLTAIAVIFAFLYYIGGPGILTSMVIVLIFALMIHFFFASGLRMF